MDVLGSDPLASLGAYRAQAALESANAPAANELEADADAVARNEAVGARFEALLSTMLVKEMRRSVPEGFFGDGPGAEIFDGWLDEHLGAALAEDGTLDLAGMVTTALSRPSEPADSIETENGDT